MKVYCRKFAEWNFGSVLISLSWSSHTTSCWCVYGPQVNEMGYANLANDRDPYDNDLECTSLANIDIQYFPSISLDHVLDLLRWTMKQGEIEGIVEKIHFHNNNKNKNKNNNSTSGLKHIFRTRLNQQIPTMALYCMLLISYIMLTLGSQAV